MKTLLNYFFIALAATAFFACEKNDVTDGQQSAESIEAAENEAAMEEMSDDIDEIAFYGSEYSYANGKVAHDDDSPLFCAEVTHNLAEKTIIIDYGDGCEDPRGRERKGKIIITYTTLMIFPGAEVTVTFEDFYIGGVKVEGLRKIKNVTDTFEDFIAFEVSFENGKFTWEDGSFATRNAHWIVKWFQSGDPLDDEKHLEGSANGTTHAGVEYSVEIIEPVVFKRACRSGRIFIPVAGMKVVVWNGRTKTVDYGNGECDRLVNITAEGITTEVELKARFRRNS